MLSQYRTRSPASGEWWKLIARAVLQGFRDSCSADQELTVASENACSVRLVITEPYNLAANGSVDLCYVAGKPPCVVPTDQEMLRHAPCMHTVGFEY
jgi:hypothetical protein